MILNTRILNTTINNAALIAFAFLLSCIFYLKTYNSFLRDQIFRKCIYHDIATLIHFAIMTNISIFYLSSFSCSLRKCRIN